MGHKPFYCSIDWTLPVPDIDIFDHTIDWHAQSRLDDLLGGNPNYNCYAESNYLRNYLEDFFYSQGVDIYLSGHVHNYERMAAIHHNQTIASDYDDQHRHVNPNAPIFILCGYPGNNHIPARVSSTPQPWSRFSTNVYGFGKMWVYNKTHIYWE